ncbi:MAG: hypothetical protein E4G99_06125 [Anaerolineales bacterium]|nr:MAG: hypothetical protein E4G99_06125 [Anaerolineales bacterium]
MATKNEAILVGSSVPEPVISGRLAFGHWQGLFLCEFDGPHNRQVQLRICRPIYFEEEQAINVGSKALKREMCDDADCRGALPAVIVSRITQCVYSSIDPAEL